MDASSTIEKTIVGKSTLLPTNISGPFTRERESAFSGSILVLDGTETMSLTDLSDTSQNGESVGAIAFSPSLVNKLHHAYEKGVADIQDKDIKRVVGVYELTSEETAEKGIQWNIPTDPDKRILFEERMRAFLDAVRENEHVQFLRSLPDSNSPDVDGFIRNVVGRRSTSISLGHYRSVGHKKGDEDPMLAYADDRNLYSHDKKPTGGLLKSGARIMLTTELDRTLGDIDRLHTAGVKEGKRHRPTGDVYKQLLGKVQERAVLKMTYGAMQLAEYLK